MAVDRSHPVLTGFAAWRDLTVFQVVKRAEPETGEVILALDDDTPLLVEYPLGAGRLMVLTTALDPEWSSLVVRPAFVVFMANLLGYLAEDLLPSKRWWARLLPFQRSPFSSSMRRGRAFLVLQIQSVDPQ